MEGGCRLRREPKPEDDSAEKDRHCYVQMLDTDHRVGCSLPLLLDIQTSGLTLELNGGVAGWKRLLGPNMLKDQYSVGFHCPLRQQAHGTDLCTFKNWACLYTARFTAGAAKLQLTALEHYRLQHPLDVVITLRRRLAWNSGRYRIGHEKDAKLGVDAILLQGHGKA